MEPAGVDDLQHARRRADQVHSRLVELGATVATAESLTGGLIGVAGPATQNGRPVGEVHVGIATPTGVSTCEHRFAGNRNTIRVQAAAAALTDLLEELDERLAANGRVAG